MNKCNGDTLAHRYSFKTFVGEIPKGMVLHHKCNNPPCVNPKHLEISTIRRNTLLGNSPPAKNKRKTSCKWGHPLVEGNIYYYKSENTRLCRTCKRDKGRDFQSRRVRNFRILYAFVKKNADLGDKQAQRVLKDITIDKVL